MPGNPEVFVSYAREDRARAASLVGVLERHGLSVFWDDDLATGEQWRSVLQERLDAARAVVVLWSRNSVASRFVVDEAHRALESQKLIPAQIEDCRIPLGFGGIQTADLSGWDQDEPHEQLSRLVERVQALVRGEVASVIDTVVPRQAGSPRQLVLFGAIAAGVVAITAVVLVKIFGTQQGKSGLPSAEVRPAQSRTSSPPPPEPSKAKPFVRVRPESCEFFTGIDGCVYSGCFGMACLDAFLAIDDSAVRAFIRRLTDARARLSDGDVGGVAHAELAMLCADDGPCKQRDAHGQQLDDGYACLTKAEAATRRGDHAVGNAAHERACRCDFERAQLPVMGGTLACDAKDKPVHRGGSVTPEEARDIIACAECEPKLGPEACAREIAALRPGRPQLAEYIASVHVPHCQRPTAPP
jgi:hypothetical protein